MLVKSNADWLALQNLPVVELLKTFTNGFVMRFSVYVRMHTRTHARTRHYYNIYSRRLEKRRQTAWLSQRAAFVVKLHKNTMRNLCKISLKNCLTNPSGGCIINAFPERQERKQAGHGRRRIQWL